MAGKASLHKVYEALDLHVDYTLYPNHLLDDHLFERIGLKPFTYDANMALPLASFCNPRLACLRIAPVFGRCSRHVEKDEKRWKEIHGYERSERWINEAKYVVQLEPYHLHRCRESN